MLAKIRQWYGRKTDVRFIPARPTNATYVDLYKYHLAIIGDVEDSIAATERVFDANVRDQIRFYRNHVE